MSGHLCPLCGVACRKGACSACYESSRVRAARCKVCGKGLPRGRRSACSEECGRVRTVQLDRARKDRPVVSRPQSPPEDHRPRFGWYRAGALVLAFHAGSAAELAAAMASPPPGCCLWAEARGIDQRSAKGCSAALETMPRPLADAALVALPGWLARQAERLWGMVEGV